MQFLGGVAEQVAKISESAGILMRVQRADGNAGSQSRQDFKFLCAHAVVERVSRERVGDQREKRLLRRQFFNHGRGIATPIAQNINRRQR